MIRKLKIKFVAFNMVIVTVMLCIIFAMVYNSTRVNLENESISMMKTVAANPFRLGRPGEYSPELRLPYFSLQLGRNGELISTGGGYYDLSDKELLRELIEKSVGTGQDTGIVAGLNLRFCKLDTPMGTTLVFADMSSENTTLNNLVKTLFIVGTVSFLVFLFISVFLARLAVKPVEEAWQQQKQFVADASHELKTPLTVIMTNADLLQSEDFGTDERMRFSTSILVMSRQMKRLVENMLELARSDAGQPNRTMQAVDFSKLVLDVELSFEGVFVEKGMSVESSVEPGITVHGNEHMLREVIDILLDNACKYSSPGGQTEVALYSSAHGKCRLTVSNPGEEIPPDELKNIFRRFYRMDKARSRDGSFGLGLSIAESIVTQHKGKIWAESRNGINSFIAELKKEL